MARPEQYQSQRKRRQGICRILASNLNSWVKAETLACEFKVSQRTIMKDMDYLMNTRLLPVIPLAGKGYMQYRIQQA
jgi:predicted DNA-binding transcriptional regulator YafY